MFTCPKCNAMNYPVAREPRRGCELCGYEPSNRDTRQISQNIANYLHNQTPPPQGGGRIITEEYQPNTHLPTDIEEKKK